MLKVCKITKTFGTHGIRHGFISFLVNSGVSSDQIGWLVGHSSSEITKIYSHVDEDTLSKVLKGLSQNWTVCRPVMIAVTRTTRMRSTDR